MTETNSNSKSDDGKYLFSFNLERKKNIMNNLNKEQLEQV